MKQMYLESGSELRIECHRLIDAEEEAKDYNKLVVSRAKYKKEQQEYEEFQRMMDYDPELEEELASHDVG